MHLQVFKTTYEPALSSVTGIICTMQDSPCLFSSHSRRWTFNHPNCWPSSPCGYPSAESDCPRTWPRSTPASDSKQGASRSGSSRRSATSPLLSSPLLVTSSVRNEGHWRNSSAKAVALPSPSAPRLLLRKSSVCSNGNCTMASTSLFTPSAVRACPLSRRTRSWPHARRTSRSAAAPEALRLRWGRPSRLTASRCAAPAAAKRSASHCTSVSPKPCISRSGSRAASHMAMESCGTATPLRCRPPRAWQVRCNRRAPSELMRLPVTSSMRRETQSSTAPQRARTPPSPMLLQWSRSLCRDGQALSTARSEVAPLSPIGLARLSKETSTSIARMCQWHFPEKRSARRATPSGPGL
mmetsp:Transcript_11967/g.32864  ORF Transcript_11967/g.32864 Transcript_11967/m.32864 type:complete len:354 (+) Transcript_11967:1-1062(+)